MSAHMPAPKCNILKYIVLFFKRRAWCKATKNPGSIAGALKFYMLNMLIIVTDIGYICIALYFK